MDNVQKQKSRRMLWDFIRAKRPLNYGGFLSLELNIGRKLIEKQKKLLIKLNKLLKMVAFQ